MHSALRRSDGTTLVEAVVGGVILGIVGIAVLSGHTIFWRIQTQNARESAMRNMDLIFGRLGADNGVCERNFLGLDLGNEASRPLGRPLQFGSLSIAQGGAFQGFGIDSITVSIEPSLLSGTSPAPRPRRGLQTAPILAAFSGQALAEVKVSARQLASGQTPVVYSKSIFIPASFQSGRWTACLIQDPAGGGGGSGAPPVTEEQACQDIGGIWHRENDPVPWPSASPLPCSGAVSSAQLVYGRKGCDVVGGMCRALGAAPILWLPEDLQQGSCVGALTDPNIRPNLFWAKRCNIPDVEQAVMATSIGGGPCPSGTFLKSFRADGTLVCGDENVSKARTPNCLGTCERFNVSKTSCQFARFDRFVDGVYAGFDCDEAQFPACGDDTCP